MAFKKNQIPDFLNFPMEGYKAIVKKLPILFLLAIVFLSSFFSSICFSQEIKVVSAELYFERNEDDSIRVSLMVAFEGGLPEQESEKISIFRGQDANPKTDVVLPLTGTETILYLSSTPCQGANQIQITKCRFQKTVALVPFEAGYTIVWEKQSLGFQHWNNVESMNEPGIRLFTWVGFEPVTSKNQIAKIGGEFPYLTCLREPFKQRKVVADPEGDSVAVEFSPGYLFAGNQGLNVVSASNSNDFPSLDRSFPLMPPPYLPIPYKEGFSATEPLGVKNIKSNDLGEQLFSPKTSGGYFISYEVSEFRRGQKVTSHPIYIRMQVRD